MQAQWHCMFSPSRLRNRFPFVAGWSSRCFVGPCVSTITAKNVCHMVGLSPKSSCAPYVHRLLHFCSKTHDSKIYISAIISSTPRHCGRYDVEAICLLSLCTGACHGSNILNNYPKIPNPIVVLTYSYSPPQQFVHWTWTWSSHDWVIPS